MSSESNASHLGFALLSWTLAVSLLFIIDSTILFIIFWVTGAASFGSFAKSEGRSGGAYGISAMIVGPLVLIGFLAGSDPYS